MRRIRLALAAFALCFPTAALFGACSATNELTGSTGTGGASGSTSSTSTSTNSTTTSGGGSDGGFDAPPDGPDDPVACDVTFTYAPGQTVQNVRVAGEWEGFDLANATTLSANNGVFTGTVKLKPGLYAYKVVYDDTNQQTNWILDPGQGRRKYLGGTENSAVKVHDCRLPSFEVKSSVTTRPSAGQGTYSAELTYKDGVESSGADGANYDITLEHGGKSKALSAQEAAVDASGNVKLSLSGLDDGKYRVMVHGKTKNGRVSEVVRLIFWVEPETFSWSDAIIYMVMTDRYRDGDAGNNAPPVAGADPRGDFQGGDLQGVTQSINDGTLDKLGVRAIWLSPFGENPKGAFLAADGVHMVTGYHGYWPIKGRAVDGRLGGDSALHDMVVAAHAHGIRVLQDFVIHHVHQDHEYIKTHPEWFILNGCVCGTNNCDWTAHALDCKFTDYLPNIDHTNPDANAAFMDDAVYWMENFDLDGFRIDAVKHVPEAATRNLAAEVREGFERAGTKHFLMGETAMGWKDCPDPCNDGNYGTISKYIGPLGIDGQLDFVAYHGISYNTFAYGDKGMIHADYWFNHGQQKWPKGAIMTTYIGSQDTARFVSLADYRGQDGAHDRGVPGNQWANIANAPGDAEPYRRMRVALAWLLELPGAPLLYYGDEYGQFGGSDPNNRLMWRGPAALNANEAATLAFEQKLGTARRQIPALRHGDYVQLFNTSEDTLAFGRLVSAGNAAIVGITRLGSPASVTFDVGALGLNAGTKLHDAMGGPDVTVAAGNKVSVTIPASGAVILAP
jgi:glycosidase